MAIALSTMYKDGKACKTPLPPGAHFGRLTQVRDLGGLVMAESHYAPGLITPRHAHETSSFTMILHGAYVEEHQARSFDCCPGRILFRTAGEKHYDRIGSSGAHCVMLEIRSSWRERLDAKRLPSSACQMQDGNDLLLRLRRELTMVDDATPLAGFANQPHLSRTFKAMTGLSPGEFRRGQCKPGAKDVWRVKDATRSSD